jgi:type IV fimbrial biogenesis protein FimT
MKKRRENGFTLMELLITISIAGILFALGIPSFSSMMKNGRINAQYSAMEGALFHARSEAIKGASDVTVCPKNAIGSLTCGVAADWTNGWIVFVDQLNTPSESVATIENQDDIITVLPELDGDNTVFSFGSKTNSALNAPSVHYVRYLQNGSSSLTTGSIIICDTARGSVSSKSLNIVQTGDIRQGTVTDGSTAPRDVFNRAISMFCPDTI